MAERSTATSPPQDQANAREAADTPEPEGETATSATQERPPSAPEPVELHSGHRLAGRYRLEECITRLDGFSSWRAVDEKLRRAVGVHVLPASHERAATVLSSARSTALLGDPRFVQVLDAVEEKGLVHVIHEWLPDAQPLHTLLHSGPLDAHEAQALAGQVAEAMAAAHQKNLVHLRLNPATVLRTGPCQFRIRGLAVDAALRGIEVDDPQRTDTEAIGALLYAALTQRWPYPQGVYGLSGIGELSTGSRDPLLTPDQVRAGVHRRLSELAMRALVNDGATAASEKPALTTPEELRQALAALPRIRPPEPTPSAIPQFHQPTTFQRGSLVSGGQPPAASRPVPTGPAGSAPPPLSGRWGTALKLGVSALLIAALGLGSWQLADALLKKDSPPENPPVPGPVVEPDDEAPPAGPVTVSEISEFDPLGSGQNPESAPLAIDDDPASFWHTKNYYGTPNFGNLKPGLGLLLDLGEAQEIQSIDVEALGSTSVEFRVAPADATTAPSHQDGFTVVDGGTGTSLTLEGDEPVETRFVLVWLTELPQGDDGNYRGRITDISVHQ
ncbi:protein kinase family protein [Streptomyces sp. DSM 44915]|uniref:Protein kinase family protein n=1 Tax=Streptomyces chisholmiae TaxID=3075540 RepID=A0ABU2JQU1_9ACTN|nr:protein kinase family protein [Streptomyces sp. DSM 44915]MDT0267099.1 protein kinase family protein [Streptomyces sp. DSM 44915]